MLPRPCLTCGTPTRNRGGLCTSHGGSHGVRGRYGAAYERNRALVVADALDRGLPCWLCGEPFAPGELITAEHMRPKRDGGSDELGNLAPAHERCNYGRAKRT